jgi:tetratricopeptide (TPR) repeat protein
MRAIRDQLRSTISAVFALSVFVPLLAAPAENPQLDLWNDPQFQKKFLGSYGINSDIEPSLTAVEKETLREVLPLLQGGDTETAAKKLKEVTTPQSSALFDFTLGNVRFQQGKTAEATEHYQAAIEKFPSYRRAHKNLGLILVRDGAFEPAIRHLSKVIELGGGDGMVFGLLGYAYMNTQQYVSAESAYRQAILLERDTLDWKMGLTQSVFKQSKYAEAVALTEELIKKFPDRSDFWLLQGNAYIGLGKPLKAAENFELVQRMGEATPRSMKLLGDIYVNQEMWDLAARAYRLALELEPDQPISRPMQWVKILAQRGALPQSQRLLGTVKEVYGDELAETDRKELLKLEARLALNEGEGGKAVDVLEEIVTLDPLDGEALMLLGQHYASEGDVERAIFYYERAQNVSEVEAEAKLRHAQLLVDQGQYEKAIPLLKRVQELEPRDDVSRYLEQVQRVARSKSS